MPEGKDLVSYAETDAAGRYTLPDLPDTHVLVSAEKTGYITRPVPSADTATHNFEIFPGGVITGHISDGQGEPLDHIQIEARATVGGSAAIQVTSDDQGAYRFFGLEPGRYILMARRESNSSALYYPGRTEPSRAEPVEVTVGGESSGINFRFESDPAFRGRVNLLGPGASGAPAGNRGEASGSINGIVTSAQTGELLKSASVRLSSMRDGKVYAGSITTGPGGGFTFERLEPGVYGLSAEKPGYEPGASPVRISLGENQTKSDIQLKLNRAGAISGRVRDVEHRPLAGIEVSVYRQRWERGRRTITRGVSTTTDDRGMYRLPGLLSGTYFVAAKAPVSGNPRHGELDFGSGRVFYPSATSPSQSVALALRYGQEMAEINFSLTSRETFSISGIVSDAQTGGRCGRCVIRVVDPDEGFNLIQAQAAVASDGAYRVRGLKPGSYRIIAEKDSAGLRLISSRVVQVSNRDLNDVQLVAGVARTLTGRVVFESQKPEEVTERDPKVSMSVEFEPSQGSAEMWEAKVERDDSFSISNLSPETYHVSVSGLPEGAYLKAVRTSGRELLSPEISVEAPPDAVEVVISYHSAKLAGQVKPPTSSGSEALPVLATVILIPRENQPSYLNSVRVGTQGDGTFKRDGIPPGSYTAFAFTRECKLDLEDPQVQQTLQNYGKPLVLEGGKASAIELSLVPDQN